MDTVRRNSRARFVVRANLISSPAFAVNNSSYYLIADSIINSYLMKHCGIRPYLHPSSEQKQASIPSSAEADTDSDAAASVIGLIVSSDATYFASTSFPSTLIVGLRVTKLGKSSVQYEVGIREEGENGSGQAAVVTHATHVFVERHGRRPVKVMPRMLREGLEKLLVEQRAKM